LTLIRCNN